LQRGSTELQIDVPAQMAFPKNIANFGIKKIGNDDLAITVAVRI